MYFSAEQAKSHEVYNLGLPSEVTHIRTEKKKIINSLRQVIPKFYSARNKLSQILISIAWIFMGDM